MDGGLNRRAARGSPFPISLASPTARARAGQHPTLCSAPATIPAERIRGLFSGKYSLVLYTPAAASSRQPAASVGPSNAISVRDEYQSTPFRDRASLRPVAPAADSPIGQKTAASSKSCCDESQTALSLPGGSARHHHRTSYHGMAFHCEHPSSPPCHSMASRQPNRTGTLLRRHPKAVKADSVVHFVSAGYTL